MAWWAPRPSLMKVSTNGVWRGNRFSITAQQESQVGGSPFRPQTLVTARLWLYYCWPCPSRIDAATEERRVTIPARAPGRLGIPANPGNRRDGARHLFLGGCSAR